MSKMIKLICVSIVVVFGALLLVGCGGDAAESSPAADTPQYEIAQVTKPTTESQVTTPTTPEDPTTTTEPGKDTAGTTAASDEGVVASDDVNFRKEASTSGEVIGKLAKNTVVKVITKDYGNGWSKIEYDGKTGFMATQYLSTSGGSGSTKENTGGSTTSSNAKGVVNADDVNARSEASTSSKVVTQLAKNTEVTVVDKNVGNGWYKIKYDDKIMFIASQYVTIKD